MNKSPLLTTPSSSANQISGRRLAIVLYVTIGFLYWTSMYLYVPTLPVYVESKINNLAMIGVILSMYGLWQAMLRLPLGIAADWLGWRKPFILSGLILAALGAAMLGLADSPGSLIVGRAVTGLAAAAWVSLVVAFNSLFPPREAVRATAMISLVSSGSQVLATSVTGSLNQWGGYGLAFFLATGIACLGAVLVWPAPEQRRPSRRPSWQGTGRLITRQDVLLPSLLGAISRYVNWATMFAFIPILADQLGGTDVTQSMLVTLYLGVTLLGILGATAIANRIGAKWLVYTSFGLLAIGVGEAALASSLPVLFFSPVCLGLAQGVLNPVLMGMSIQYVADDERTTAMGLHQSVYAIGMFAGPWFSGILAEALGLRPMLGVTAVACLVLSYVMATRLNEPRQTERLD